MENSVSRLNFLTLYTELWLPGIVPVWETPVYTLQVHSHSQRDPSSNKNVCVQGGASRKSKEAALKVDWRPRVETHEQAYLGSSASLCYNDRTCTSCAWLGAGLWHASLRCGTP